MGMDVFGKNPTSQTGEYFRNNVWWWHPLWDYCMHVAPDIIPPDNLGHSNDGWGLDRHGALQLADRLANELASGATLSYQKDYTSYLESLLLEPCTICGGTGKRAEPPQIGPGPIVCNGCGGEGKVKNFQTNYPFDVENVREFEAFLRDCGGFSIS